MNKNDCLAFDRASVRTVDVDGRLHVEITNISKSNVCPYYGREIPNATALGLDPDRIYQLLRDPDELQRAAATFNNIPLLSKHVPFTVDEHDKEIIVGSTGTSGIFDAPFLKNSLVVWDAIAIAGINSKDQCELSSAYRYTADMTPGVYEGTPYDGAMRNIQGNHVALVEVGRAGPDVVVGDSQITNPKGNDMPMSKHELSVAKGKVIAIAMDAKLKPTGLAKVKTALDLAMDAECDQAKLEIALKAVLAMDEDDKEKDDKPADKDKPAEDDDEQREDESNEDYKKRMDAKKPAEDEDDDGKKDDDKDKAAMDAAIKSAVTAAEASVMKRMNAIKVAEKEVQPLIGEVVAQDSAEAVYKLALDHAGVDLSGVHASAYGAMVRMLSKPETKQPRVAMDSSINDGFAARFPTAGKLTRS